MTQTIFSVTKYLVVSIVFCGTIFAGAHNKDNEGCVIRECEQHMENASLHCLDDQIYYETGILPELNKNKNDFLLLNTCFHVEPVKSVLQKKLVKTANYDPRIEQIRKFFAKCKCPVEKYSEYFIRISDAYQLDWRLLPTLAYIESTGGKHIRNNNNNIFGWNSGKTKFKNISEGINMVAKSLSESKLYQNKTTLQKLRVYNVHLKYHQKAISVMQLIENID